MGRVLCEGEVRLFGKAENVLLMLGGGDREWEEEEVDRDGMESGEKSGEEEYNR